jgi:hypothetical protein
MKMITSMRKIIHFGALESKLKYVFNVKVGFQMDFKDTLEIEIQQTLYKECLRMEYICPNRITNGGIRI